jgi:hypothetical protein
VLPGYDPDPYDNLAASYRDAGHDDRADTVSLVKQQHRYAGYGSAGRIWGWLQEWTVGYGYRPWRAGLCSGRPAPTCSSLVGGLSPDDF